ncbi:FecR family protein [Myxococcota bacterium]
MSSTRKDTKKDLHRLRRVSEEAARARTPEVDWERVEAKLFERISQPATIHRVAYSRRWGGALLAAAASVALVWAGYRWHCSDSSFSVTSGISSPQVLDGARLEVGQYIETSDRALRVQHSGRATWTLASHSRVRLVSQGRTLSLALQAGALEAEVKPGAEAESFVVEVGQTRVAVRGTIFGVEHAGRYVQVAVRQGTVFVGPVSPGDRTEGFVLSAPASGVFSLDGARSGRLGVGRGLVPQPSTEIPSPNTGRIAPELVGTRGPPMSMPSDLTLSSQKGPPACVPVSAGVEESRPISVPEEQPSAAVGAEHLASRLVVAAVARCFSSHTPTRGDLLVTATFELSTTFSADGSITGIQFDPSLPQTVEACSRQAVTDIRGQPSESAITSRRTVTLRR